MSRSMRCVIACLAVFSFAPQAPAADLGYLRGSDVYGPGEASYYNWGGLYLGGQAGYANAWADFGRGTSTLIAYMLRETTLERDAGISQWTVLGTDDVRDITYGGFIGYNSQWENLILGLEANYNRISASLSDSGSLRRIVPAGGDTYDVTVNSEAALRITDYGSLRARVGWVLGRFLPYATFGLALGRAETSRSASVISFDAPTGAPYVPLFATETKATYAMGYAAGAGIDVAVLPNVFLRGEIEWLQFTNLPDIEAHITTGRVAAGVKF